jgi:hypothetical protein
MDKISQMCNTIVHIIFVLQTRLTTSSACILLKFYPTCYGRTIYFSRFFGIDANKPLLSSHFLLNNRSAYL